MKNKLKNISFTRLLENINKMENNKERNEYIAYALHTIFYSLKNNYQSTDRECRGIKFLNQAVVRKFDYKANEFSYVNSITDSFNDFLDYCCRCEEIEECECDCHQKAIKEEIAELKKKIIDLERYLDD